MRRAGTCCAVVAAALAGAVAAPAQMHHSPQGAGVDVRFSAFGPQGLDILPSETVTWRNVSERRHSVDADDGSFASGDLQPGDLFTRTFDTVGTYPYHCTVHPGMVGEVDVRHVTLDPLPGTAVLPGTPIRVSGRTADVDEAVRIQRADDRGEVVVATVMPQADGSWSTVVAATASGTYRAISDAGASQARKLIVVDRRVQVRVVRDGLAVTVTPPAPYALLQLQQLSRERFGWWPVRRATLDYVSQARFRIRSPARVRVVLVDRDGWTPLAVSRRIG